MTKLAEAIGHDPRIGSRFLAAGLGFGGGCLPKDIRAFMARAGELGAEDAVAAEIARAMNGDIIDVSARTGKYNIGPYQSTHNAGGAVMGSNPATSVVNKYLQSWDVPNVFVVGASAFPQNGSYGPTGTVGALACWTADAIKDLYLKKPSALI